MQKKYKHSKIIQNMTNICIFGDSTVWGAYDSEFGGWVARLRKYLEEKNDEIEIYNCGVSGDNTEKLLRRFEVEANAREPEVIIFAIGINDSQYLQLENKHRVEIKTFEDNLKLLFEKARKITNKIIFLGLTKVDESKTTPTPWEKNKFYTINSILKYNTIIKSFCEKNKIPFINLFDELTKEDLDDGLHPNSQGHKRIFEKVRETILNTLPKMS